MQNCYPSCGEWRVHFSSHVCLCRKWIKSCCLAGWLSVWTSLTGLGLSISMFTVGLCRMTLVWTPVPVFLCSGGALFNYFRKCWSQSAHVVSFLVKGYNFQCLCCSSRSGMTGGKGWRRAARAARRIAGVSEGQREQPSPVADICYRFPLRSGNEYSHRFVINCEGKISGDG